MVNHSTRKVHNDFIIIKIIIQINIKCENFQSNQKVIEQFGTEIILNSGNSAYGKKKRSPFQIGKGYTLTQKVRKHIYSSCQPPYESFEISVIGLHLY